MNAFRRYVRETDGGPAAEFAMLVPAVAFLLFGSMNLFLMTYAWADLNSSAEYAARQSAIWYNVNAAAPSASQVTTWGASVYIGPGISAAFTLTQATNPITTPCNSSGTGGSTVAGTGTYNFYYGFGRLSVPLKANACYT
jgi:hypothetical protein